MEIFTSTINQTLYLFSLILVGFLLGKYKLIPDGSASVLAKLESLILIPAVMIDTFMKDFTVARLGSSGLLILFCAVILAISIPMAFFLSRRLTKDKFTQNIYIYGLIFSNFGYMGLSVVRGVYPQFYSDYVIFVLPLYVAIYAWGVSALLIDGEKKITLGDRLKSIVNPMFIGVFIGMILGLLKTPFPDFVLPGFISSSVSALGSCMSPVAMLLTGITVSNIDIKKTFTNKSIYLISVIRLVAIPAVALGIFKLLPLPYGFEICALCSLSMPLGLNTVVIPSAYGKDTSVAAGMALVSHLLSCITIPLIFLFA